MHIGVPKEIKDHEYRVGLTPDSVRELVKRGPRSARRVRRPGWASVRRMSEYRTGRRARSPMRSDRVRNGRHDRQGQGAAGRGAEALREGQILFTYLHLAPDAEQTRDLVDSGAICIAYETITDDRWRPAVAGADVAGRRPAVDPGRGPLPGEDHGGRGMLLGGVPGRCAGARGGHRRRRRRRERHHHGAGHGRRCDWCSIATSMCCGVWPRAFGPR